ncbi:hypothetical protein NQ315_012105 [Exocentrus adspersus]|uniref:Transmembrane protein 126A n=1 Tax=Exocentrus adspersus TaxID=1586481 RepID=A0AAV8VY19_9CUCU|nr:hypothetical protein NQ315_012105 [Exocentrus adspersus]
MALERKRLNEIPSDAVMLSEEDALNYHYKILNNWKNDSDVFAYRYGAIFLGITSSITGVYLNSHFRKKLKLFHYGKIASYLPLCTIPAFAAYLLHQQRIVRNLVLLNERQCPVCLEIRASAFQNFAGLGLPLVLTPIISLGLAHKYGTYNLPLMNHQPLELVKVVGKLAKPIKNVIFGIFIGHALLGSIVTYFEAKSIYNVDHKLAELEKNLESQKIT